ncbi:hypothetical protein BKA93DRAFT_739851, partial [Sparassis latifolia]
IHIIQSAATTALYPLVFFWSTLLMSYITADVFCCAYPHLTLQCRGILNLISLLNYYYPPPCILRSMEKYTRCKFDF